APPGVRRREEVAQQEVGADGGARVRDVAAALHRYERGAGDRGVGALGERDGPHAVLGAVDDQGGTADGGQQLGERRATAAFVDGGDQDLGRRLEAPRHPVLALLARV